MVHVFDLSISTEEAIHQQQVMEKETKPTRIEFNPIHPMIIVGDDKGNVASLKIIPNPHEKPKVKKDQEFANGPEAEVAKLDKVVRVHRPQLKT
uniref:Uncharacterized protein n=1 Tax=Cyprinodon variegatus TaxID=28743 RepID=A0A3Q2GLJ1_CYPVA